MSHFHSIIRCASRKPGQGCCIHLLTHITVMLSNSTLGCVAQPSLHFCLLRPPYLITHMMLWGQTDVPHIDHHHRKSLFESSWKNTDTFMELVIALSLSVFQRNKRSVQHSPGATGMTASVFKVWFIVLKSVIFNWFSLFAGGPLGLRWSLL